MHCVRSSSAASSSLCYRRLAKGLVKGEGLRTSTSTLGARAAVFGGILVVVVVLVVVVLVVLVVVLVLLVLVYLARRGRVDRRARGRRYTLLLSKSKDS